MPAARKTPTSRVKKPKQGKKSSGGTQLRIRLLDQILHGTKRTWTVKQLQTHLASLDAEYEVDPVTVRRNLGVLVRSGSVTEHPGRPAHQYEGRGKLLDLPQWAVPGASMNKQSPMRWIPIETFSGDMGETVDETLEVIQQGHLDGIVLGGRWYVLNLATVEISDTKHPEHGRLHIAGHIVDGVLTASSGTTIIDLTFDPGVLEDTVEALLPENPPPTIEVLLGKRTYVVDRSLRRSIAAALLAWWPDLQ
jgi:hypothetical protein